MKKLSFKIFVLILSTNICFGKILNVPSEYVTIQSAMNAAATGDTVLVDEGPYYENIRFYGKSIIVASKFILDQDPDHITNTIINGSEATNSDSASCVMFYGEDANAVLQGFTLTEGRGTKYILSDLTTTTKYDGQITVEGGGIFFNKSSATVKNNLIINNEAAAISGYDYNGGGAISSFCGNPSIYNNVIIHNRAVTANGTYGYASGIVFNESNGTIRNNIIYNNHTTGRAAIFIDINKDAIVENNTIVGNTSDRDAAGIFNRTPNSIFRNNIVWGNINSTNQIMGIGDQDVFEYTFTDQVFSSRPTVSNEYPDFGDYGFILDEGSPCIDAGNPEATFNDVNNSKNDVGAYGGPYADVLPEFFHEEVLIDTSGLNINSNVNDTISFSVSISNTGTHALSIDSIVFPETLSGIRMDIKHQNYNVKTMRIDTIPIEIIPQWGTDLDDWVKIYHNGRELENPIKIKIDAKIEGPLQSVTNIKNGLKKSDLKVFPNPASTILNVVVPGELAGIKAQLFDMVGKHVLYETISGSQLSIVRA
ncbi:hypothetical protein ACFLTE_11685, partial [Bacteroidota bacterium]